MIYWAPIHYAARYGRHDFIQLFQLLRSDFDINIQTLREKRTLMHILALYDRVVAIMSLKNSQNIDRNAQDVDGRSAIIAAGSTGHADAVQVLGSDGVSDVNVVDVSFCFTESFFLVYWVCFKFMAEICLLLPLVRMLFNR